MSVALIRPTVNRPPLQRQLISPLNAVRHLHPLCRGATATQCARKLESRSRVRPVGNDQSVRPNVEVNVRRARRRSCCRGKDRHITIVKAVDREILVQIVSREDELMPGFLDTLPARVNRVAFTLIIDRSGTIASCLHG